MIFSIFLGSTILYWKDHDVAVSALAYYLHLSVKYEFQAKGTCRMRWT